MRTVLVYTNSGHWGKGKTLNEAKKNAKYERKNQVRIFVFNCEPEEVIITEHGGFTLQTEPTSSVIIEITDGYEKI